MELNFCLVLICLIAGSSFVHGRYLKDSVPPTNYSSFSNANSYYDGDLNMDDYEPDNSYRQGQWMDSLLACAVGMQEITEQDKNSLCYAAPVDNLASKCLIDCQLRRYNVLDRNGFNKRAYVDLVGRINEKQIGNRLALDEILSGGAAERTNKYLDSLELVLNKCVKEDEPWNDNCTTANTIVNCIEREGMACTAPYMGYKLFYHAIYVSKDAQLVSIDNIDYANRSY